jgi:hypothetical protein
LSRASGCSLRAIGKTPKVLSQSAPVTMAFTPGSRNAADTSTSTISACE